ncbi:TIR domain-containing protein [Bacillus sp. B-jedd]|uniref:TIR domain-containing protein n=1 Tax=Bacillus sp. B-jedd TaxID=1476857 RepID=UPI0005156E0C|nr:nucleotide-binding protein [Bacillus sp. B-jedd]CEG26350.1 putative nucleotide-binding protein containing TIR-like domain protein [Bacillus sp. B-jedd]
MAQKKQPVKEVKLPPKLETTTEEAILKLQDRIEKGKKLLRLNINNEQILEEAEREKRKWSEYNLELLNRLFDNSSIADEYSQAGSHIGFIYGDYSFQDVVNDYREYVEVKLTKLESIFDRLDIIPEKNRIVRTVTSNRIEGKIQTSDVFIVHGHDEGSKETVARLLSKFDLNPIILHEQPNGGKTIIEKFEEYSGSVNFAVILMTPDDIGYPNGKVDSAKPRARQNVIFELGYFIGKLSRKNVCALYREGVEIPSDYQGVLFIPMDSTGAWRYQLAKELKNVGYDIDMNEI